MCLLYNKLITLYIISEIYVIRIWIHKEQLKLLKMGF